eukprot:251361-Hanusia_phi.AAC.1
MIRCHDGNDQSRGTDAQLRSLSWHGHLLMYAFDYVFIRHLQCDSVSCLPLCLNPGFQALKVPRLPC